MSTNTEKLFSYGTLQYASVQQSTFGRILEGAGDVLAGYRLSVLTITDPKVLEASQAAEHPILVATGRDEDEVKGMVFDITSAELRQADSYEVEDYKRIYVQLQSGVRAWVYVSANT